MDSEVHRKLDLILERLDAVEGIMKLANVGSHLMATYMALVKSKSANARAISKVTGKRRAVESGYLNELCRLGLASKKRIGREVEFSV